MNSNSSNRRQTALITGASSGIGYELTKIFAREGYDLVLIARSEQRLRQLAGEMAEQHGISALVLARDLSDPTAPDDIFADLERESVVIDVLVNNAGFADYSLFAEADLPKLLQMIQVNMVTLTHLTKLFLPGMIERGRGRVLNMASTAAFQPGPLMAVYYATKAYVLSFSEAVANELKGTPVTMTALCPGPTESGFQQRASMEDSKLVSGQKIMDAATVAEVGYQALMEGKSVAIPGLKNSLLSLVPRFLPRDVVTQLVRETQASIHEN